ncbi:MAG: hypothetical protein MR373_00370 [Faecalibacterium prausnitzii]|nr:hypothetical protein [Faecalibacterium prausnitzii]MDD7152449.1 hypothetical protein [Faecalibacterium prausnitzii]
MPAEKRCQRWGNVPFRYFDTAEMLCILLELEHALQDTAQAETLHRLAGHFYRVNRLTTEISDPLAAP